MPSVRSNIVLMNVDHKWRDLAGCVYAKLLLEQLGYRVVLIRNNRFDEHYCNVLNPCAVVMVHLYDRAYAQMARRLRERGILIILMPNEGIPSIARLTDLVAGKGSDLSPVDLHFAWGETLRQALLGNLPAEKVCLSGSPRFDFYHPHLQPSLPGREQLLTRYRLDPARKTITWATNFTHASFYEQGREFLRADWKKLGVDRYLDADTVAHREHEARELHFAAVTRLLERRQDVNLILKLHPSEDHTFYDRRLAQAPPRAREAIRIVRQDHIWNVLRVSDVHLGRSCTTSVEAWILGKPTLEMYLHPQEVLRCEQHAAGADVVTNVEELAERVDHYLAGGQIARTLHENRRSFLDQWCGPLDGQATRRFAEGIDRLVRQRYQGTTPLRPWSRQALKSRALVTALERSNFRIHNWKVYGLRRRLDKLGRWDKYFDRTDERQWIRRLSPCLGANTQVSP